MPRWFPPGMLATVTPLTTRVSVRWTVTLIGTPLRAFRMPQSDPNTHHVTAAIAAMECVVVQDLFLNETAKYGPEPPRALSDRPAGQQQLNPELRWRY